VAGPVTAVVAEMVGHLDLQSRSKTASIVRLLSPSGPSIPMPVASALASNASSWAGSSSSAAQDHPPPQAAPGHRFSLRVQC
jgi:hypothetical protein